MARRFWSIPKLHPASTIVCLGSGPSLTDQDLTRYAGAGPVIAVNSMALLAPWADYAFFGDSRWWRWHGDKMGAFQGRILTAGASSRFDDDGTGVLRVEKVYHTPLGLEPHQVAGIDSGRMAMNVAYHLGATKIVLAGYDMGWTPGEASHAHAETHPHDTDSVLKNYVEKFAPAYLGTVAALQDLGVSVVKVTPSPALHFIPSVSLDEVIG